MPPVNPAAVVRNSRRQMSVAASQQNCIYGRWKRKKGLPMTSVLLDLRKVVDFPFVHLFSCCVNRSDDFQAPYVLDQKPEVSAHLL